MATNSSSQMGLIPSETIVEDNTNEPNLSQMMSTGIVITSQPIIPGNQNPMIAPPRPAINNGQQRDTLTRGQLGRRRRLQLSQHQQRLQQSEPQQWLQRQLRQRRREQQEAEQQQRQRTDEPTFYHFPALIDNLPNDSVLKSYEFERMDPQQRWEQEQVNELEAVAALEQQLITEYEQNERNQMTAGQTAEYDDETTL